MGAGHLVHVKHLTVSHCPAMEIVGIVRGYATQRLSLHGQKGKNREGDDEDYSHLSVGLWDFLEPLGEPLDFLYFLKFRDFLGFVDFSGLL